MQSLRRILAALALPLLCAQSGAAGAQQQPLAQSLRIFETLGTIKREYVDPLEEATLVARCMTGMDNWLAARGVPIPPADGPEAYDRIARRFSAVQRSHPDTNFEKLADACLAATVESLDSGSGYLDRERYQLQFGTPGQLAGVGLEFAREGEYTRIVSVIEDTPAARSGLRADDLLVAVDGTSTRGLLMDDVVRLTRGRAGSVVVLDIERAGEKLRFGPVRQLIRLQSVRSALLDGRLAYLRIVQFQANTRERFLAALRDESVKAAGGLAGIVIDVRGNAGGLLDSCAAIAAAFLPESALVLELRGRTPQNQRRMMARPEDYVWAPRDVMLAKLPEPLRNAPLAVLVDGRSAACAEILAAALQDHGRARVIGERTPGHGAVQTLLPGGGGALRLTTARIYRPNGRAVGESPVQPDVEVAGATRASDMGSAADAPLARARDLLR